MASRRRIDLLGWTVSIALVLGGCKDNSNPLDGQSPSNVVFPVSGVSYQYHVQPLFNQACTQAGCHDDGQHQSPLKLTSFGNTVLALPGVVVSGQPDQSTLVFRIEGRVGERMPPTVNPLNQNQINGIRTWIAEGAKNN
jgi:hypothetical protein